MKVLKRYEVKLEHLYKDNYYKYLFYYILT